MMNYYQCLLSKGLLKDRIFTVAWMPEKYARVGKIVKLKNESNEWTNGWKIESVYSCHTEEFILAHERDFTQFLSVLDE
jgi:hypothetical protein